MELISYLDGYLGGKVTQDSYKVGMTSNDVNTTRHENRSSDLKVIMEDTHERTYEHGGTIRLSL
jgi:hypothetical protein